MIASGLVIAALALVAAPSEAQDTSTSPFHSFDLSAQAQAGAGFLFAVGDEVDRLAGARTDVTLPENVVSIGALFQRGLAAGYTYGATVGRSGAGGAGLAPEPPPGEAYSLSTGPTESKWEGPITGATGRVIDGRTHAKTEPAPSGVASVWLQALDVPGQLSLQHASTSSRGGAVKDGVEAEAQSVVWGLTIGGVLKIDSLSSRAFGAIRAAGDPEAIGSTTVQGASVGGVPVLITEKGVEVAGGAHGGEQKAQLQSQVDAALSKAGFEDVRLAKADVTRSDDGQSVQVKSGSLRVLYNSAELKASNPQGFAGGGFEVGGASVVLAAQRCSDCAPADTGGVDEDPALGGEPTRSTAGLPALEPRPQWRP